LSNVKKVSGGWRTLWLRPAVLGIALVLFAAACKKDNPSAPTPPELPEGAVPEFAALDVNPTSSRLGEVISPRDYLGSVSAWYFGHST
jgi:hypothetical protein